MNCCLRALREPGSSAESSVKLAELGLAQFYFKECLLALRGHLDEGDYSYQSPPSRGRKHKSELLAATINKGGEESFV